MMNSILLSMLACTLVLSSTCAYGSIPSPPLRQFKSGILAQNVHCTENFILAGKTNSGMDGVYEMELEPGTYDIVTQSSIMSHDNSGSDLIKINVNKTTIFNITLDSGIR